VRGKSRFYFDLSPFALTFKKGVNLNLRWATFAVAFLFLAFLLMFEIMPGILLVITAFTNKTGFSLEHVQEAIQRKNLNALLNSINLSWFTALEGGILGTLTAGAIWSSKNPAMKRFTTAISGVSANFAGVPLAFAFVVILGSSGIVNLILGQFGIEAIDLYSKRNLHWVYLYFQWPLMTVLMLPAFNAIQREWLEAARGLGSSSFGFWFRVGIPVLLPTLLGSMILLFANSFGAYATVYALSQGTINLLPTQIGFQVSGSVGYDPGGAAALSLMMAVTLLLSLALYRLSRRWAAQLEGAK
jgi:putative spermidine/putrescine transport system permease protein